MARYIKTEDAIPYLTKYIPSVEAVERSKSNKAIEEIEDLDPITERVGLQVKQEILNILKRNIGE